MKALIGIKKGMTQLFDEEGNTVPCTIIDVRDVMLVDLRSKEKNGYNAIVIGKGKKRNSTNAEQGIFKKIGIVPRYVKEFAVNDLNGIEVGAKLNADVFATGDKVTVSGISKGKGFQGVVKRWGFHGGPKTHGQSDKHRSPGSIGSGTTPGRVWKGKRMGGRMGTDKVTVKNLIVAKVMPEEGLICLKGSVPGPNNGLLYIQTKD